MARRNRKVSALNLASAVKEVLNEYGEDVYKVLDKCVKEVAQDAEEKLQAVSSFAPGRHPTGDYSRDWTVSELPSGRLATARVVHNLGHYRLTHLLENGHVSRNGTHRTFGRVPAYPHIAPVNDWACAELPKRVSEEIKRL